MNLKSKQNILFTCLTLIEYQKGVSKLKCFYVILVEEKYPEESISFMICATHIT